MDRLTLTADREGERLDAFVARSVPGLTRSAVQRLLEAGAVTRDGVPGRKNDRTVPGQLWQVDLPDPEEAEA